VTREALRIVLVAGEDAAALAAAASALLLDPDLRRRIGGAARATVQQRFATTPIARRMVELYRQASPRAMERGR